MSAQICVFDELFQCSPRTKKHYGLGDLGVDSLPSKSIIPTWARREGPILQ